MMDIDTGARHHDTSGTTSPEAPPGPTSSGGGGERPIDRWKELLVVDASVRLSSMANSAVEGAPLSFATVLTEMAGGRAEAEAWVMAWLESFAAESYAQTEDGTQLSAGKRSAITSTLICPWLNRRPQNGCDAACGYCRERVLDLAQAPFALLAVVNRPDLGEPCAEGASEGRLVYTALRPGPNAATLPFTVIFEYRQPGLGRDVASRWHALGDLPFGNAYNAALASITDAFVRRGQRAAVPLFRVRTNEGAFGGDGSWEMREFSLGATGLVATPLAATPTQGLDGSTALATFLRGNTVPFAFPSSFATLAAPIPSSMFRWRADVPETQRRAFSAGTCNGCHGGERPADPLRFQHIGPAGSYYGSATQPPQVSRYLDDPSRNGDDELGRRAGKLEAARGATCDATRPPNGNYPAPGAPRPITRSH
jgi:hypothetical protein